jgi:hypothetical protein
MTEKDKQLFTEVMENTKKRINDIDEELATTMKAFADQANTKRIDAQLEERSTLVKLLELFKSRVSSGLSAD